MLSNLVAGNKTWVEASRSELCKASIAQSIKEVYHRKKVGGVGTVSGSMMLKTKQPRVHHFKPPSVLATPFIVFERSKLLHLWLMPTDSDKYRLLVALT